MKRNLDIKIWVCTLSIMAFGLISLYSATFENVRVPHEIFYDQLFCALASILIMYVLSRIDYKRFYDVAYILYILNIVLLIFVLITGRDALGARRWISILGINFQPSELTKLAIILALGRYYANRKHRFSFGLFNRMQILRRDLFVPLALTLLPMVLIFKQPDLGTSILMFGIFLTMAFISGTAYRYFFAFIGCCLALVPFAWHILRPYQKDRLLVFLNPNIDPLGAGYTIIQSKIAVGSGQLFGKGWLSGTQNHLNFLPERHTDFIFSVIGEEWGLLGTLIMLTCYFFLIIFSLKIAEQVKDRFGMFVTIGIVSIFSLQVIINIGMVTGLFPIVGITLPMVSYGRTSFLVFAVMAGFLLNLSKNRMVF